MYILIRVVWFSCYLFLRILYGSHALQFIGDLLTVVTKTKDFIHHSLVIKKNTQVHRRDELRHIENQTICSLITNIVFFE